MLRRARVSLQVLEDRTLPAVFTVSSLADSGAGSLRQAISDANSHVNSVADPTDAINFTVAGTITLLSGLTLDDSSGGTIIDGRTAPGWSGAPVVILHGANSSFTGLSITRANNAVWALQIDSFGTGIDISSVNATGNVIAGNFIGTNGTAAFANGNGILVQAGASLNTIGGTSANARNVISGNSVGIGFSRSDSSNNVVRGNYIGTDATGTVAIGNTTYGVYFFNFASNNTVGGTAVGAGNLISGNGVGVFLDFGSNGQNIVGNLIGTKADGTSALGNLNNGVEISSCSNPTVSGNTIAFNGGSGVFVSGASATGILIRSNSIFSNVRLGIDLVGSSDPANGVTPNDTGDGDLGPNNLQNYPVLNVASSSVSGGTFVTGTLNSTPNATFTVEFFASTAGDSSGFGEGAVPLGLITVTTDGSGNASFATTFAAFVPAGQVITATATSATNNTSEFSQWIAVVADPTVSISDAELVTEGDSGTVTAVFTVTLSGAGVRPLTVKFATLDGTAMASPGLGGNDYQSTSGTLTFAVGETTKTVEVLVNDDAIDEDDETFYVRLSDVLNGTIGDDQGVGTIVDNDPPPTVSIGDVQVQERDSGFVTANFTVTLSVASAKTVQVSFATADGSAVVPDDYEAGSGVVTFSPGQLTATVSVNVRGDLLDESDETFTVTLSSEVNATIDDGQGIGTIVDDDTPPVAGDDEATTAEDIPVVVNVLNNDTDADHDTLIVTAATDGEHGTVAVNPDNTVTYTPDPDFYGTDSFTYTIDDGRGFTATGIVTVAVSPVQDDPEADDDSKVTDEDTAVAIAVLVNDSDVDGDTLTVTDYTQGGHGLVENNGGTLTYTPEPNFNGTDSFTYTISDGHGGTDTATVTVTVHAVNDAPDAIDDDVSTDEDAGFDFSVVGNDEDVDRDTLTVTSVTQPANGWVVPNSDGTLTYSPNANFHGSDSFTYTITDGHGEFDTATVTVTVNSVNDDPAAHDDTATTNQNVAVKINVLANDTDVEGDTLDVESATDGAHGTAVVSPDGRVTYTPDEGFFGSDSFSYTVSDGNGGFATASVSVTVNEVTGGNHPPEITTSDLTLSATTINEGGSITLGGSFRDEDVGQTHTVLITWGDGTNSTLNLAAGERTFSVSHTYADDVPTGTPSDLEPITVTVTDSEGAVASAGTSVTVSNVAPTVQLGPNRSVAEGSSISLTGNFTDPGGLDTFTFHWHVSSSNGQVVADGSGQNFSFTPNDNGTYTVTFTVTDDDGGVGQGQVIVTATNVAPMASVSGPTGGVRGQARTFTFSATDPSAIDQQAGFRFYVNWGDGSMESLEGQSPQSLDHVFTASGTYTVTVTAKDKDYGVSSVASWTITIAAIALQQDPTDPTKWAIVAGGTTGIDTITFTPGTSAGQVVARVVTGVDTTVGTFTPAGGAGAQFTVTFNGATIFSTTVPAPATLARVIAYGQDGDDHIAVVRNMSIPLGVSAYIFGGCGNDELDAGGSAANNVIAGGAGQDRLWGGSGRDLLIGGTGADQLRGGDGDDILIGEKTCYDSNITALTAMMAEWSRTDLGYSGRIAHLSGQPGGLNGPYVLTPDTVHTDGESDDLWGFGGQDWFFAKLSGPNPDKIKNQDPSEIVTLL